MANYSTQLNQIFGALTDPTRRAILQRLTDGPASMKELASPFDMALPTISQHLDVLEECHLVSSKKNGRVRTYTINTEKLKRAENWLQEQRHIWEQRADRLGKYLKTMED